jgi:hypothetical protein
VPTEVYGPCAAATTGVFAPKRIHILSGYTHYIYDPEKDAWSDAKPMLTPRKYLSLAVVNDSLYAIGGGGGFSHPGENNENEQYTPSGYIPEFPTWTPMLITLMTLTFVSIICKRRLFRT